ncbi:glycosyl hydrolase family 18 protein [Chengkuizengella axinellae]|uniref:Glycosyl hydrolase family 18 protein n=1 Tax=Chengkuizengella axinellae TaxID=3064388 RepID=A0ABT9IXM6_9BACL|nr:glycosyl hydrolase family 18 protein [Chengkuizengella sp. 2205SS18-9]MDP5274116.1 glycosyl hydrolase family 18 protein [Chengkuizengella sp. 2205SS18-9]
MKKSISVLLTSAMVFTMITTSTTVEAKTTEQKFEELKDERIFNGYEDGLPHLEDEMTREQAAKIITLIFDLDISNIFETPTFSDVSVNRWSYKYIETAAEYGIINGIGEDMFAPDETVTYEQFAKMLTIGYEVLADEEIEKNQNVKGEVSEWAEDYVAASLDWDFIESYDDYTTSANRGFLVDSAYSVFNVLEDQGLLSTLDDKVLAFYTKYNAQDMSSYDSLVEFEDSIDSIATTTYSITNSGEIDGLDVSEAIDFANDNHIKTYATVNNGHVFDADLASLILNDKQLSEKTINNIEQLLKDYNYDGINLDFEDMHPEDREAYTLFVQELADQLQPKGYEVIVSVSAKTTDNPNAPWSGAFDYTALGEVVDYIQLMTYDQNGPWGEPGPVSGLDWVENVLKYAVSEIDSDKILIGINSYGYDWNLNNSSKNKSILWSELSKIINTNNSTQMYWDDAANSPYLTYTDTNGDEHIVWYEDSKSITDKVDLVDQYGLAGVSVWEVGLTNDGLWTAIEKGLQK